MKKEEANIIASKFLNRIDEKFDLSAKKPSYNFIQKQLLKFISFFKDDSVYMHPPKFLTSQKFSQIKIKRAFTKDQLLEYNDFWAVIYDTDLSEENRKYIVPSLNWGEGSFLIDKKTSLIYEMGISLVNESFRSDINESYDTFIQGMKDSFPPSEGIDVNEF